MCHLESGLRSAKKPWGFSRQPDVSTGRVRARHRLHILSHFVRLKRGQFSHLIRPQSTSPRLLRPPDGIYTAPSQGGRYAHQGTARTFVHPPHLHLRGASIRLCCFRLPQSGCQRRVSDVAVIVCLEHMCVPTSSAQQSSHEGFIPSKHKY